MNFNWLFGRSRSPRAPVVVAFLVLLNALMLRVADPPALSQLRDIAFDNYQRLKPRERQEDMPVRIVVFAEADRTSIANLLKDLPAADISGELRRLAEKVPDNDQVFAAAIKQAPVITAFGFDVQGLSKPPRRFAGFAHNSGEKNAASVSDLIAQFIPKQTGVVKTIDVLESAAKGNGSVTTDVESAIVRQVPMLFRLAGQREGDLYPALALEALRVVQGASTYLVRWSGAQGFESFGE